MPLFFLFLGRLPVHWRSFNGVASEGKFQWRAFGHGFLMIFVEATVSVKFIFMKGCLDKSR